MGLNGFESAIRGNHHWAGEHWSNRWLSQNRVWQNFDMLLQRKQWMNNGSTMCWNLDFGPRLAKIVVCSDKQGYLRYGYRWYYTVVLDSWRFGKKSEIKLNIEVAWWINHHRRPMCNSVFPKEQESESNMNSLGDSPTENLCSQESPPKKIIPVMTIFDLQLLMTNDITRRIWSVQFGR